MNEGQLKKRMGDVYAAWWEENKPPENTYNELQLKGLKNMTLLAFWEGGEEISKIFDES